MRIFNLILVTTYFGFNLGVIFFLYLKRHLALVLTLILVVSLIFASLYDLSLTTNKKPSSEEVLIPVSIDRRVLTATLNQLAPGSKTIKIIGEKILN